jgi:nitrilase
MTPLRVAAVQASYVLMDRDATIDRVAGLTATAARDGAELVVFPEVFVPGTPIWIDTQVIWEGDEDWFGLLASNAVVIPSPASERLGAIAAEHGVWLVVGVDERDPHGATIYNTVLYFSPGGVLAGRHRKLMPTGAERTVWGMGDGSTLPVVDTGQGRIGGLTCWENYMPLARFHLYAQGIDLWIAPTLAMGDGWIATMRHIARENRMFVVGVNPVLRADQIPAGFPARTAWSRPATWRTRVPGWRRATRSRSRRTARCWPGRCASARRRCCSTSTWPPWPCSAGLWTRLATTTAQTCSGFWSTRPHARRSPR